MKAQYRIVKEVDNLIGEKPLYVIEKKGWFGWRRNYLDGGFGASYYSEYDHALILKRLHLLENGIPRISVIPCD